MAKFTSGIYRSIELRDYEKLDSLAREAVSDRGWKGFLRILSKSQIRGNIIPGWNISVRRGALRDALFHLLDLKTIIGLDCKYLSSFGLIESNDLDDVRNQAFPIAIDLLREQVKSQNTFFLDTDALSTTPYAIFVKDIISTRITEIESLPSKPSLRQVYGTYYGFTILSSGKTSNYPAGATEEAVKCVEDLSTQFGKQTKLNARIFQPSRKAFTNCTSETKELLWNILRMFNGGWDTRSNAAKKLGLAGDSRATDYIILNLQNSPNRYLKSKLLTALGALGDAKGLDNVLDCLNDTRLRKTAILALGSIRNPKALEKLIQIKNSNDRHDLRSVIPALGATRNEYALKVLSSSLSSRNGSIIQKTVETLCSIGKVGLDILTKVPSKLVESLRLANKSHKLIRILKRIPDFKWTSELKGAIAQAISQSRSRVQYIIKEINSVPELASSDIILDGLLKRIEKISKRSWRQWEYRRLLRGGSVQYFLAMAIKKSTKYERILDVISKSPELRNLPEIRLAVEYVRNRDNPQSSPTVKRMESPRIFHAKQEPLPEKPAIVQQSLLTYLESLVKLDIEFSKKHGNNKRLTK